MALAASWTIAPSKGKNISEEVKLEHSYYPLQQITFTKQQI